MSKEWKCKDCVLIGTDACEHIAFTENCNVCQHSVIDPNYAYEQGRTDERVKVIRIIHDLNLNFGDYYDQKIKDMITNQLKGAEQ